MRSHNPRHYLIYINLALLVILLLEIGFYFFVFPKVAVTQIELESDSALSDADVRQLLGFERARNYYSVDSATVEQYARNFALVSDIEIRKEFPNRLKVRLQSRKPVLVILQKSSPQDFGGGNLNGASRESSPQPVASNNKNGARQHSLPILVDAEGVMFQFGLGGYEDVPVLSGLEFLQGNPLHSRLPSRLFPLVAALGSLKRRRPELYAMISEVQVIMDIASLETNIYLEYVPCYIKTDGKLNAHTIETALLAMEVLERSNVATEYLDMRTTGIVYRPRAKGDKDKGGALVPVLETGAKPKLEPNGEPR